MGIKIFIACLLGLGLLLFPSQVSARQPQRRMQHNYSIQVIVECLPTAAEVVLGLAGFNLRADMSMEHANFTRRVENWAFGHVQAVLRDLGEVVHERETTRHLDAELDGLDTRLRVLEQEIERLMLMMAGSRSLDVLIAVDSHLSRVMWERDNLIGRHNQLMNDAQSTVVQITLTERWVYVPTEEPGFGERVANSFMASWRGMVRNAGNFTVFMARVSIPLFIWLVIGGCVLLIALRVTKKQRERFRALGVKVAAKTLAPGDASETNLENKEVEHE